MWVFAVHVTDQMVDWSVFGFNGRDGAQSTYWLGSQGAYTVCHYDTYGCNLVAQIYGRYIQLLSLYQYTVYNQVGELACAGQIRIRTCNIFCYE